MLDRLYNAKICDFGLTQRGAWRTLISLKSVKSLRSMEKTHITLKEGGNGGSPRYMASAP